MWRNHDYCNACFRMHKLSFNKEIFEGEEVLWAENQRYKAETNTSKKFKIAKGIKDFTMRLLIQAIEEATEFNFYETARFHKDEPITFIAVANHYCFETPAAKEFREKRWEEIWREINGDDNKWYSGEDFGGKPDFFQRYCHYLHSSGLIHYWEQCEKEKEMEKIFA